MTDNRLTNEYVFEEATLWFAPASDKWYIVNAKVYLTDEDTEFYAWMPVDMTTVLPDSVEEAKQYIPDALSFLYHVEGMKVKTQSDYDEAPEYSVINFDSGETIETFDTYEDAREFLRIHPNAKVCTILHDDGNGNVTFVD